jgi:hypothetical protein
VCQPPSQGDGAVAHRAQGRCLTLRLPTPRSAPCSYYNLSRFNEKFERAYVAQAAENVRWQRRQKELLDGERTLMQGTEGWVVGKRRYLTQWDDRPDVDVLDKRKLGPW